MIDYCDEVVVFVISIEEFCKIVISCRLVCRFIDELVLEDVVEDCFDLVMFVFNFFNL